MGSGYLELSVMLSSKAKSALEDARLTMDVEKGQW